MTVSVDPAKSGTVTVDGVDLPDYPHTFTFPSGQTVEVKAVAVPGYVFLGWSGDSSENTDAIKLSMTCNKSVTARFAPLPHRISTAASPPEGGTVTLEPSQPTEGYLAGTQVTFTAVPKEGYRFSRWAGSFSTTDIATSVIIDGSKVAIAIFEKIPPSLVWLWSLIGAVGVFAVVSYVYIVRRPVKKRKKK